MAKRKPAQDPITELPEPPKHHEMQTIAQVELVRGRVLRLQQSSLGNLRSFLSMIPGNEHAVERLRGQSGDDILARVADFVMMEIGDNSRPSKAGSAGVSRYITDKARGAMGPANEGEDDDEAQTA